MAQLENGLDGLFSKGALKIACEKITTMLVKRCSAPQGDFANQVRALQEQLRPAEGDYANVAGEA